MAIKEFDCKGYGQLEPTQVWFNRAGMSESQCFLDPEVFASSYPVKKTEADAGKIVAEVGVFYIVDKDRRVVTVPTKALSDFGFKMGINYSTERIYDQYKQGRRNFCQVCGEPLPRIGFVEPGMRILTNAICWDDTVEATIPTSIDSNATDSVNMYNGIKEYLAERKLDSSKEPIYVAVIPESKGRLCVVNKSDLSNALGNVYGIITDAYYNADRTLAFKISFIDKPVA